MNERSRNLIVGSTTLFALIGLAVLLLLFGYVPKLMQDGYYITLQLPDASSLNPGSRVELAGIDVGEVKAIEFRQPVGRGVSVSILIRDGVRIPTDAVPQVDKPLLGGSPTIKFGVANQDNPPEDYLATDDSAVVRGKLGALAGAFGELERMTESFESLSKQWNIVGQRIDHMLTPQDLEAVEAGEVPGNVTTVMARLDRRLAEFQQVLQGVDELVNDQNLRADLSATASNARQASEQLSKSMVTLEQRYAQLAGDASETFSSIDKLLKEAGQREGTVGKLLGDPSLYHNLDDAAERIGAAAEEMMLLIEKWKAEGVPVKL